MRLLLWALLVTLVAFVSGTSATTPISDSDDTKNSQLKEDVEILKRLLTVESDEDSKRFLRGADEKDLSAENEERAIFPSNLVSVLGKVKNGWSKVKTNWYEKAFQRMKKNGETPDMLAKRLGVGGQTEKRFKTLHDEYKVWWDKQHSLPTKG